MNQKLLDLKALQEANQLMYCPRCGRDRMNAVLHRNALSRHADLYICSDCGTAEAMLDMMRNPLLLEEWAVFDNRQPRIDLKDISMAEVVGRVVNEHIPKLTEVFLEWTKQEPGSDFVKFRVDAMSSCPGLLDLRASPFCAVYQAKDGRILIRFKCVDGKTEMAIDTMPAKK